MAGPLTATRVTHQANPSCGPRSAAATPYTVDGSIAQTPAAATVVTKKSRNFAPRLISSIHPLWTDCTTWRISSALGTSILAPAWISNLAIADLPRDEPDADE